MKKEVKVERALANCSDWATRASKGARVASADGASGVAAFASIPAFAIANVVWRALLRRLTKGKLKGNADQQAATAARHTAAPNGARMAVSSCNGDNRTDAGWRRNVVARRVIVNFCALELCLHRICLLACSTEAEGS